MIFNELETQHPPRWTGSTVFMMLIAAGLSGWLLKVAGPAKVDLTWLGAVVLLDASAASLGPFGLFSGSYGAILLLSSQSLRAACLALWLGLGIRSLLRGHPTLLGRLHEMLVDLLPGLVGLVALHLVRGPLGWAVSIVSYGVVWFLVPGFVAGCLDRPSAFVWGLVRESLTLPVLGSAACGALAAHVKPAELAYFCLPALFALGHSAKQAREATRARLAQSQQQAADTALLQQQRAVVQTEQVQKKTESKLQMRMETYSLIERMLRTLPDRPSLKVVAHGLIEQIRVRIPTTSVVIFLHEQARLVPAAYISPHGERLKMLPLTHESEPVVERAWRTGVPQRLQDSDMARRVLNDEPKAAAVALPQRGAIYVGDTRPGVYTEEELEYLEALAEHARLLLDAAYYHQGQNEALQRESLQRSKLESALSQTEKLLEGLGEIVLQRDPQQIARATQDLLPRLIPCDHSWLQVGGVSLGRPPVDPELHDWLLTSLASHGKPLYYEDLSTTRFNAPGLPRSLLMTAVTAQSEHLGFLAVASQRESAFERQDIDAMQVLSYEMGGAFKNALLYHDLASAHRQLKESQAQLVQSSKMAAVGQLAGGVAHELNTPLGAISVAIDAALMNLRSKPDRAEGRLQKAAVAATKMKAIVSKLLFYSTDSQSHKQETDLNVVVQDTLELLGNQFNLDNLDIRTRLGDVPVFAANQNEVQQILINLLVNAKDAVLARQDGPKAIEIRTYREGDQAVMSVRDSGIGIPGEVLDKIFDPFFTTKEVGQGTGLGLSVSMQLAKQHGGELTVQSQPGQGSMFCLRLPLE